MPIAYNITLLSIFRASLEARELSFEDEPALEEALFRWKDSACGFSDCLITSHNRQVRCRATATFDGKAARLPGTVSL
jgi:predicted nucleic-acid-binding protein